MKRRSFVVGSAAAMIMGGEPQALAAVESLAEKARRKGLIFGCAVRGDTLVADKEFAAAVARDAGMLVHEYEMKRSLLEQTAGNIILTPAEPVIQFARKNKQAMRGTPLVWYKSNPGWLGAALDDARNPGEKEKLLTGYVSSLVGSFAGAFHSWDVVNEPVEPNEGRNDGMRADSIWFRAFGEDYIRLAFETARAADPKVLLMINDYNVEHASRGNEARRTASLKLLERLKSKNVPIDGFGIQGHIKLYRDRFDQRVYGRFLDELLALGLKIMITEFDVSDKEGPSDSGKRDSDVAEVTRQFLDVSLENKATLGVLTWGLSDRYSWLTEDPSQRRPDGLSSRGLPLDVNLNRKPMWGQIAAAFDAAAAR